MRNVLRGLLVRLRQGLSLHLLIDITTLLASVATVFALVIVIHDRRDQANIAAWTLLQTYLQSDRRVQFNEGQNFALATLVHGGIALDALDAHDTRFSGANLSGMQATGASFRYAFLVEVDLSGAWLGQADLQGAEISNCRCHGTVFNSAELYGAKIIGGTYNDAKFYEADVSDLRVEITDWGESRRDMDPDALTLACFQAGHP